MDQINYINQQLILKGYKNIETYIEKRSNEILFDEVWLWRVKEGVKQDLPHIGNESLISILKNIIMKIIKKGGVIVDYSRGEAEQIINNFNNDKDKKDMLVDKIATFIIENPNYGSDGNGIWFE